MLFEQKKQALPDEDLIYELEAALEFFSEEFHGGVEGSEWSESEG